MSKFLTKASEEQEKVIKSEIVNHSPIVVVAGAGSGKTTTIINKMGYSIENGINPFEMLALSFSNKSAKEITDRVLSKLGGMANGLKSGTFHSISLNILKENVPLFKGFRILDSEDDKKYIKKIYNKYYGEEIKKIKDDFKTHKIDEEEYLYLSKLLSTVSEIQWIISRSKNTNENIFDILLSKIIYRIDELEIKIPEKYTSYKEILFSKIEYEKFTNKVIEIAKDEHLVEIVFKNIKYAIQTIKEYETSKLKDKYLSFDDLLINVVSLLNKDEIIRRKIDKKYKYVYVDEFQDVNFIQFEFLKLINKDNNYLIVVGDADQAIYSFRGCNSYYFTNMKTIFPNTKIFQLNDNYRSDGHIVGLANASIENNTLRYEKNMNNIKEPNIVPKLIETYYEDDLYEKIAEKIKEKKDYGETAILYRNNNHSLQIQKKLIEYNIPFNVVGGQNILNKKYSKDIRSLISFIDSLDILSFERIITIYPKIGAKTADKLIEAVNICKTENKSLEEQLDTIKNNKNLYALYNLTSNYIKDKKSLIETINLFFEAIIKPDIYKKIAPDKIEKEIEDIETFISIINDLYIKGKKIDEILELITLDNIDSKEQGDKITLSTIHRSKGLEWNNVYILKAYKYIFPGFKTIETKFLFEEERNLFYVAVTRAKKELFICQANAFKSGFDEKSISKSEFVEEIIEFLE